ncbi:WXG100 family type VII secretion target [Nocardia cyriacigeorgica]|uniref:ESAT-6-like protein n=1 Tax=Nocardia cyriacigeorgica TaxID=135487 RepID=A0A5R8NZV6_9NOCA|nr:WXG100 family type VII secretion target [Nocardia cyriacigeorgica]TLF82396.1 WXG100 family type VII secretion target [Nocardia cyriacigeorgica]
MKYSEGQLMMLAGDIRTSQGRINETRDELRNYINQLRAEWETDEARTAYDQVQARWDNAHDQMISVLERIAKVVEDGAINMSATDKQNAGAWLGM